MGHSMSESAIAQNNSRVRTLYLPELLYVGGAFQLDYGMLVDEEGVVVAVGKGLSAEGAVVERRPCTAILPGLVNGHSHSFQRLIRGVAEHAGENGDDFWAWRNTMYRAALHLTPDEMFAVARMAFLEMACAGITTVGEFHYVHRQPDGGPYEDPNLLAKRVIDAATSVGIRICLLRVAYARAGFELPPNPGQRRFYESCDEFLSAANSLAAYVADRPTVSMGVAPHSIRATSLPDIERIATWADENDKPIHLHMAEQTAELTACVREHEMTPVALMAERGLLSRRVTLVHAIHITDEEVAAIAKAGTTICSCPTTERNLGDGIIDADKAIAAGIPFSFGSDSQATINLLEDARELDYHLRLKQQRRVLLDRIDGEEMSTRLFRYATVGGAQSLRVHTGVLQAGYPADFFAVDLTDVSIAGSTVDELLSTIVFTLERTAVKDVVVNGQRVIWMGKHAQSTEIVAEYRKVAGRVASVPS